VCSSQQSQWHACWLASRWSLAVPPLHSFCGPGPCPLTCGSCGVGGGGVAEPRCAND
jgi:hypothetical protein